LKALESHAIAWAFPPQSADTFFVMYSRKVGKINVVFFAIFRKLAGGHQDFDPKVFVESTKAQQNNPMYLLLSYLCC
jgi:hypothetical protein